MTLRVVFVAGEIGGYPALLLGEPDRSMNFGMSGHACSKNMNQRYMLVSGVGVPGTQEPPSRSSPVTSKLTELRFYVLPHTAGHFRDVLPGYSWLSTEKVNLTQQKQLYYNTK